MYVSSYSTYVSNNTSEKILKERTQGLKENSSDFKNKLLSHKESSGITSSLQKNQLPINYVSNYKVISNQQKLQDETSNATQSTKYIKMSNQNSAKLAYVENSSLFSLQIKPKVTLNQTPSINTSLSSKAQEAQESILKNRMLNTYIANDNYYKITA